MCVSRCEVRNVIIGKRLAKSIVTDMKEVIKCYILIDEMRKLIDKTGRRDLENRHF